MEKKIYLWWVRNFKVISNQQAEQLGLRHWRNVYGDEINRLNCRSIWLDYKKREYRVSHLINNYNETFGGNNE